MANNETTPVAVVTDLPETPESVPFYKNRRLIKGVAITTAVVGVVAVIAAKFKSNDADEYVLVEVVDGDTNETAVS